MTDRGGMNTNHALHVTLRSLILIALTAGAAACGAAPDGQETVDEKSLTQSPAAPSDADAAAPSFENAAPRQEPIDPRDYVGSPSQGGPSGPTGGGFIPPHQPGTHTRS
jgi:hypothetical protein